MRFSRTRGHIQEMFSVDCCLPSGCYIYYYCISYVYQSYHSNQHLTSPEDGFLLGQNPYKENTKIVCESWKFCIVNTL
jgi:hypothetical protein